MQQAIAFHRELMEKGRWTLGTKVETESDLNKAIRRRK